MKRLYQVLMEKSDECIRKAKKVSDSSIKRFLYNASIGYKNKALNLNSKTNVMIEK